MKDVIIVDNSVKVKREMNDAIISWLYEVGGELVAKTQSLTPIDTGQLKGSWEYRVNESDLEVKVGSPLQNAIWNEFGTGQYALHGDGRKTPWVYKDIKGKWHTTIGKRPMRSLHHAFTFLRPKMVKYLENKLKGLGL